LRAQMCGGEHDGARRGDAGYKKEGSLHEINFSLR
jgi:hypothetical protein